MNKYLQFYIYISLYIILSSCQGRPCILDCFLCLSFSENSFQKSWLTLKVNPFPDWFLERCWSIVRRSWFRICLTSGLASPWSADEGHSPALPVVLNWIVLDPLISGRRSRRRRRWGSVFMAREQGGEWGKVGGGSIYTQQKVSQYLQNVMVRLRDTIYYTYIHTYIQPSNSNNTKIVMFSYRQKHNPSKPQSGTKILVCIKKFCINKHKLEGK